MDYQTLISSTALSEMLPSSEIIIFDCRFAGMTYPNAVEAFETNHIHGSSYLHLNDDLSDLSITGEGRHPLPIPKLFAEKIGWSSINPETQIVVYDEWHGGMAARCWWMIQALGHHKVALLDGGYEAWKKNEGLMEKGMSQKNERTVTNNEEFRFEGLIHHSDVLEIISNDNQCLIDARAAIRYDGIKEHLDPIAGHIPSALNYPFLDNLNEDKVWKSPEELKERFEPIFAKHRAEDIVMYCGSGVTACHNILAMRHAGYPMVNLYPASWSGWISDKNRPLITRESNPKS